MPNLDDNDQLQIPAELPLLPIRDLVVFPDMIAPLFVSRPLSVAAVEQAIESQRLVMLVSQQRIDKEDPEAQDLHLTGTVGMIIRMRRLQDGRLKLLVQGIRKARVEAIVQERPCFLARVRAIHELPLDEISVETEALMRSLRDRLRQQGQHLGTIGPDVIGALEGINDPGRLADLVVAHLSLPVPEAQQVLETPDPVKRLRAVSDHLVKEIELASTRAHIEKQVKKGIDKTQRDYYLREQIKHIRTELGDGPDDDIDDLELRIEQSDMPEGVLAEAVKQLHRMERMQPESAEAGTIRTYLEWLLDMPWQKKSEDRLDLNLAREILDEDHLGLAEVKDRILEYLAVHKLNPESPAPILCLIGPPGVGKTSLGRSVARALGREFARISLGGVRDEAEVRGHRRTYVGAMPGRILQAIKQAGTINPVLMLDEIDKLGHDFRGDPASALLEVLDPEQNHAFTDHYLHVPYDLSKVLFITNGNRSDTIPAPLLDRLELIGVPGYALREKTAIAARHLLPRQLSRCGLQADQLALPDAVLETLIERYTREAGLRQLDQTLGRLGRLAARRVAEEKPALGTLAADQLRGLLGAPLHSPLEALRQDSVGIVNGLAWTPVGGEVLQIEATAMAGSGQLILTGQLGAVMKESAQTALSFTRSLDQRSDLPHGSFSGQDIHIHIPAGAIPKDGPSAGLAMVVALVSLLTRIPVRCDLAMTGEISLRGRMLPVGGLREKLLAALRAGIRRVIIPTPNADDLDALPDEARQSMEFFTADTIEQALDWALVTSPFGATKEQVNLPVAVERRQSHPPQSGGSA